MTKRRFPKNFLWGTALSGFQVEMGNGSQEIDLHTDWYIWAHDNQNIEKGVVNGDFPEDGAGFWTRYGEDLKLAREGLKNNAVRLSVEWSRIFPEPTTKVPVDMTRDRRGCIFSVDVTRETIKELESYADWTSVKRYREIFETAIRQGLTVMLTLNHFTLPDWLHDPIGCRDNLQKCDRRGWTNPETAVEFAKYAAFAGKAFGDLVDLWATINEPMVVSSGYLWGIQGGFPPGLSNPSLFLEATRNLAVAHVLAYEQLKKWDTESASRFGPSHVGAVVNPQLYEPHNPQRKLDIEAARSIEYVMNEWYLNAALRGEYDMNLNMIIEPNEAVKTIAKGCDFIGVNYYNRIRIRGIKSQIKRFPLTLGESVPATENVTDMGWEIYPSGIRQIVNWVYRTYRRPIFITENGIADAKDEKRADFLREHLIELHKAIQDGAPVQGYFHWSLLDNFEWAKGFEKKFGLFKMDWKTKTRTPTKTVPLYRSICADNALP